MHEGHKSSLCAQTQEERGLKEFFRVGDIVRFPVETMRVHTEIRLMEELSEDTLLRDVFWLFQSTKKPLSATEFFEFWMSLTENEQDYYIESF